MPSFSRRYIWTLGLIALIALFVGFAVGALVVADRIATTQPRDRTDQHENR